MNQEEKVMKEKVVKEEKTEKEGTEEFAEDGALEHEHNGTRDKERKDPRAKTVLLMRIALFFTLLLLSVGVMLFVGLYDYEEFWQDGCKNKEEYYTSAAFDDVLQSWSNQVCAYMKANDFIKAEDAFILSDKLYSLTEYSALADKDLFVEKAVTEDTLPADSVSYSDIKKENAYVAGSIYDGFDRGEEEAFFYDNLRINLQELTGDKDIKSFIHLNGREYYALLDKYCSAENLEQELIQNQFAGDIERFSENDEEDDVIEGVDETTERADGTTEKKDTAGTGKAPKGFYNEFNGSLIIYSYSGGEDGNGHFLLDAKDTQYDYAMRDVSISKDFYIPTALLDYSSRENFEKSLITTPFSTVQDILAYLSVQSYLEEHEGEWGWAHTFSSRIMNQFDYAITYLDENGKKQVLSNCERMRLEGGDTLVYDRDTKTVSTNIKGVDFSKEKDFFKTIKECNEIIRVELRLDAGFGFNALGVNYLISLAAAHKSGIILAEVLLAILAVLLIVAIIWMLPAQPYKRDYHLLFTKTVFYGVAFACSFGAAMALLVGVCNIGMHFNPFVRLIAVGIAFVFLTGIAYVVITEYFHSCIRLLKAHRFKEYLLLYRIYARSTGSVKGGLCAVKQFFAEIWQATPYAKRAIVKRVGLLLGVMGCLFMMVVAMCSGIGVLILLFFLALCAVLLLEAHDIYRLALDQKMLDSIVDGIKQLTNGDLSYKINTQNMSRDKKQLAEMINHIGDGLEKAVAQSIKDERLKAELITNVSHDIKTPLTSIINYVDLMKREHVSEEPLKGYIEVLEQKSQRLKQLTEDLVEASKASTGNIDLEPVDLNMTELLSQTIGEFEDKFSEKNLTLVPKITEEEIVIFADGRRCYRIFENLFQNIYKYAMPGTRVYLNLESRENEVVLCLKNISESPLTVDVSELTGRFVRGDASRTTEGSGLGLSIAQSLTTLQNGSFQIELDGDLFKVTIVFERKR